MTGFDKNWVDELKSRLNIVNVIGQYVRVDKSGGRYWACCPFHQEKTASFSIDERRQFYYCFGCHKGGDVITFVMEYENLSYPEALERLAEKAGMKLPENLAGVDAKYLENKEKQKKAKLLNREAAAFYHSQLNHDPKLEAFTYFVNRGISPETIRAFALGYSPNGTALVEYLTKKGFSVDSMAAAELVEKRNGAYQDKMAGRYIVPILSEMKEVVGFGGRSVKQGEAKYMNTRASVVFDKGRMLFSLYNLKEYVKSARDADSAILVEGYMDVIALYENGVKNAVASMGTALTMDQCRLLKRFVSKVYVCYDGDTAGQTATMRSLDMLRQYGLDVYVVSLPDGMDPDDVMKQRGKDFFTGLLLNALPVIEYKLFKVEEKYKLSNLSERSKYAVEAIEVLRGVSPTEQEIFVEAVAEKSKLSKETLLAELKTTDKIKKTVTAPEEKKKSVKDGAYQSACRFVLSAILAEADYARPTDIKVSDFSDPVQRDVAQYIVDVTLRGEKLVAGNLYSNLEPSAEISETIAAVQSVNILAAPKYYEDSLETIRSSGLANKIKNLKTKLLSADTEEERKKILIEIKNVKDNKE